MMRLKKITLLKERVTQPHQYPFNIPRSHRTRAKNEEWRAREDLNLQPLAPEASALSN
jgi:hypothetical protein